MKKVYYTLAILDETEIPNTFACDSLATVALTRTQDGGIEVEVRGADASTGGVVHDDDLFRAWVVLTQALARSTEISVAKAQFCALVDNILTQAIEKASAEMEMLS